MPFSLASPVAAQAPPAGPSQRPLARSADPDVSPPGSFGEALARSRKSSTEQAAEPTVRPASAKVARRPADADEAPAQNSVNPLAALLMPLEGRFAAAVTATTPANATTTTLPGSVLPGSAAAAGPAENPALAANTGLGNPGGLADLLAAAPGGQADASGTTADADIRASLATGLAALLPKGTDLAPAQARETPAGQGMPLAAEPRAVTALASAAGAGLSDPSSGQEGNGSDSPAAALAGLAEPSLVTADATPFAGIGGLALPAGAALQQQPASAVAPNAPASTPSSLLLLEVGSSEWGKALGQQVIHLSAADRQTAELQLNPPGLGPLKVTLSLSDQQMQAAFVSAHSSVRAAVEAALPQLRALLAESGISLGQTSVGAESQPQTAFASSQGGFGSPPPRPGYPGRDAGPAAALSAQPAVVQHRPGQGLRIDTYA